MLVKVQICKWDKFNRKRRDVKSASWFALSNQFIFDPEFHAFSSDEKMVWIYLLSIASQKQSSDVFLNIDLCAAVLKTHSKTVRSALQRLQDIRTISVRDLHDPSGQSRTDVSRPIGTDLCYTDITDRTDRQEPTVLLSSGDDLHPLVHLWNELCGDLAKVQVVNKSRLQKIKARWKDCSDLEQWADVIKKIAANDFCNGKNDRGWKANFDFLLKPDTLHKALEGAYDNRGLAKPEKDPHQPVYTDIHGNVI